MARSYKFAIVRLAPDDARNESINIGIVVAGDDVLDVRFARRLEKVRAISGALDLEHLRELMTNLSVLDERLRQNLPDTADRFEQLRRIGPIGLSNDGTFVADDADQYESRIDAILRSMVDAEPATPTYRAKRSKVLTQLKAEFRRERILAKPDETLESHRLVSAYELDEGLVADLILRNGAMHVIETVDASNSEDGGRKAIGDIAVSALVLERARMTFGKSSTKGRIVYHASSAIERIATPSLLAAAHQGAELVNWASANDRGRFIHEIASLATPLASKRRKSKVSFQSYSAPSLKLSN